MRELGNGHSSTGRLSNNAIDIKVDIFKGVLVIKDITIFTNGILNSAAPCLERVA